jgi:thiamine-phosphate pyrophosphorylase
VPVAIPRSPFLYAIVDTRLLAGRGVAAVVADLVSGGATLLQLRVKDEIDREFLDLARDCVTAARRASVPLLINDRPDIARIVGAAGVHVGQDDLPPAAARSLLPDGALVGVSTHDEQQLAIACRSPVDYVAVGPVFATRSKDAPDPVVGLDLVRKARRATELPIVAIGGISAANAASVIAAGADGVAVISALLSGGSAATAARSLAESLAR